MHEKQHGSCIYQWDFVFINAYTKFYQNSSICSEDTEEKQIFTSIKGHNSVVYKFSPFAIPNHSSLISMPMQSLKKISQKLLKLESGNEVLTDSGRTDRRTLKIFGGYIIISLIFLYDGI